METMPEIIYLGHAEEESIKRQRKEKVKRLRRQAKALENLANRYEYLYEESQRKLREVRNEFNELNKNLNAIDNRLSKCSICLESFEQIKDTKGLTAFDCGHVFCTPCAYQMREHCPVCRGYICSKTDLFF